MDTTPSLLFIQPKATVLNDCIGEVTDSEE